MIKPDSPLMVGGGWKKFVIFVYFLPNFLYILHEANEGSHVIDFISRWENLASLVRWPENRRTLSWEAEVEKDSGITETGAQNFNV